MLSSLLDSSDFDVVVVGSGAGGMVAAIRAHDLGMKPIVLEKSDRYGGTSAVSGSGLWIPNNMFIKGQDSDEIAFEYLKAATKGTVRDEMIWRYIRCQRRYKMGPATGLKVGQSIQTKSLSLRLGLIGVGEAAVA